MSAYLIVCPLVFLAGFVDSIAGGGGLISLPAYIIAGIPAHLAIGTNKLSAMMGITVSTARYLRGGYLRGAKQVRLAAIAVVAALAGSSLGSRLSLLCGDRILKNMMLVVLPVVAFYVLRSRGTKDEEQKAMPPLRHLYAVIIPAAFLIGTYDGFYGPGTGTFLLLVMTGPAGMDIRSASALTKILNLSSNAAAIITFLIHGTVIYPLGLAAGMFSLAGNYLGSGLVMQNGIKVVRPVILVVLAVLFLKIVTGA